MAQAKIDRKEVYKLLVGKHEAAGGYQFTASKIANFVGTSRKTIHIIIKKFIEKSVIVCDNPNDYIKFYSATTKSFESIFPAKEDIEKKMLPISQPCSQIALQKARYTIQIEKEHIKFFEKQHKHMHGNCTHYKYKTKIFDDCSEWTFEKVGKSTLVVIVPEMIFTREYLAQARATIFTIVFEALKWISKKAKIKLKWDTLHMCQKPHVCRPARDSKAIRVARDFSLNIDGKMLDMSSGKADWETTILDEDMVDTVDALETWDSLSMMKLEMDNFNDRLLNFNDKLGSIDSRVSSLEEMRTEFNKKIDVVIEGMNDIKKMVNPKPKPFKENDVAFG